MATWTNISDTFLEPGKPVRSVDGLALRDNPIAIAEGAAGAPSVLPGIAANATAGAVGTYAFAAPASGGSQRVGGAMIAGSSLRYANTTTTTNTPPTSGAGLAGTWMLCGSTGYYGNGVAASAQQFQGSLWLRVA